MSNTTKKREQHYRWYKQREINKQKKEKQKELCDEIANDLKRLGAKEIKV